MDKDEIMLAFRLIAMGRYGHPQQELLADKLVEVFAAHDAGKELPALLSTDGIEGADVIAPADPAHTNWPVPTKRTRAKKADDAKLMAAFDRQIASAAQSDMTPAQVFFSKKAD